MILDSELEKNNNYRVKIIDKQHVHFNKTVTVKFTGLLFRGIKTDNTLFLSQVEVIGKGNENV